MNNDGATPPTEEELAQKRAQAMECPMDGTKRGKHYWIWKHTPGTYDFKEQQCQHCGELRVPVRFQGQ